MGGEIEKVTAAGDAHCVGGMMKQSGGGFGFLSLAPTKDSPNAGNDSARGKGLGHVIVGAEFEAQDLVDLRIARGEEENGDVGDFADSAAEVETGVIREPDIENGKVRFVGLEMFETIASGADVSDIKIFRFEGIDQGVRDGAFIFDDKYGEHGIEVLAEIISIQIRGDDDIFGSWGGGEDSVKVAGQDAGVGAA